MAKSSLLLLLFVLIKHALLLSLFMSAGSRYASLHAFRARFVRGFLAVFMLFFTARKLFSAFFELV